MKKSRITRFTAIICVFSMLFTLTISANAATIESTLMQNESHINLDILDGYESHEVNPKGRVGYHFTLPLPNGEKIQIGFDPRNTMNSSKSNYYSIATGWQIKLPYFNDTKYYKNGYNYDISQNILSKAKTISNYPVEYSIINIEDNKNSSYLCLEEPYGAKEYYRDGYLTKTVDTFGKTTDFVYENDSLRKIIYSDGSIVSIATNSNNEIVMIYTSDGISTTFARFIVNEGLDGLAELSEVIVSDYIHVTFDYVTYEDTLLLKSYNQSDKYYRIFSYEYTPKISRVTEMNTVYSDGDTSYAKYEYDSSGHICKINKNNATENYKYSVNTNGDLTVNVNKDFQGQKTIYEDVYNRYGQLTKYTYPGNTLTLQYDSTNRIITETENNTSTTIEYNEHGLPITSKWSDGKTYNYVYSDSGKLTSTFVTNNGVTTEIPTETLNNATPANFDETNGNSRATTVKVEYDVDSNVCVLNWHKVYNLPQGSFNCYAYATGRSHLGIEDPGNISGKYYGQSVITVSLMKKYTIQDQENLGRDIYDSTVNATHNSHAWKIALKVRPGVDYHFMKRSYNSSTLPSHWEFKCGKEGPVMRLKNNKTPSTVTWDCYGLTASNKVVVTETNWYTSTRYYMIIQD